MTVYPKIPSIKKIKGTLFITFNNTEYHFDCNSCTMVRADGTELKRAPTYWHGAMQNDYWGQNNDDYCNPWYRLFKNCYHDVKNYMPTRKAVEMMEVFISAGMEERELRDSVWAIAHYDEKFSCSDLAKAYKVLKDRDEGCVYLSHICSYLREQEIFNAYGTDIDRTEEQLLRSLHGSFKHKNVKKVLQAFRNEIKDLGEILNYEGFFKKYLRLVELFEGEEVETHRVLDHYRRLAINYKIQRRELEFKEFAKRYDKVKNLAFEDERYKVIIPTCAQDFINEGNNNRNCVGGYVDNVLNGYKYVCFIRDKQDLEKSLVTCDIYASTLRINQFLLRSNYEVTQKALPELYAFRDKFQNWLDLLR